MNILSHHTQGEPSVQMRYSCQKACLRRLLIT